MVLSMFTACELPIWQWVKQFSCGHDRCLMLAGTYGWTHGPNPAAPQSRVEVGKVCSLVERTHLIYLFKGYSWFLFKHLLKTYHRVSVAAPGWLFILRMKVENNGSFDDTDVSLNLKKHFFECLNPTNTFQCLNVPKMLKLKCMFQWFVF